MKRNSHNTRDAVGEPAEQAISCAPAEVIGKRVPLFPSALICVICGLLCLGCSVTSGRRSADGSLTVTNYRLLWASEAVDFSTRSAGFNAQLKIGKSATDDEAVAAITAGVVKGITRP